MSSTGVARSEIADALTDPRTHGLSRGQGVHRFEREHSILVQAGERAYQLLKASDNQTLQERRASAQHVLELNRVLAPDLYRGVVPVSRGGDDALGLSGEGEVVDYLIEIAPFDHQAVLSSLAASGSLSQDHAVRAAEALAAFHTQAAPVYEAGEAMDLDAHLAALDQDLRALVPAVFVDNQIQEALERLHERYTAVRDLLEVRREAGLVRCIHGAPTLERAMAHDGEVRFFDRACHKPAAATIDVLQDLAALIVDLKRRNHRLAANRAYNAYFEALPLEDWLVTLEALGVLSFFTGLRAVEFAVQAGKLATTSEDGESVRPIYRKAHVDEARGALREAVDDLKRPRARVLAIGGLSGSGKSTAARHLAPQIGRPTGALVIRSDVVRKRVMGVSPTQRLGAEGYTAEVTAKVYERMFQAASRAVGGGALVILDAVFAKPEQRSDAEALAERLDVAFKGYWLQAKEGVMKERLYERKGDASDADEAVLEEQMTYDLGTITWVTMSSSADDPEGLAETMLRVAPRRSTMA